MGKDLKKFQGDILEEKYKGANAVVAAAGESYVAHWGLAAAGLVIGGIASYFGYKQVGKIETAMKDFHGAYRESGNMLVRLTAKSVGATKDAAHWLANHMPGAEKIKQMIPTERLEAVIFGGGLLGAFGFFVAPMGYAVRGAHNALQGKDQFKRAQQEIRELREDRDFLEQKNAELRKELRTTKTDSLAISKDDTPKVENRPVPPQDPHELDVQTKRRDDESHSGQSHSERHGSHHGKPHGEQVRERKEAAASQDHTIA